MSLAVARWNVVFLDGVLRSRWLRDRGLLFLLAFHVEDRAAHCEERETEANDVEGKSVPVELR